MSWIKLRLQPDDPKVAIVAQEIGASKAEAFVAMLRWLFWLDQNYGAEGVTVSPALFRAATGWPNEKLLAAFRHEDVDWVEEAGERFAPTRPNTHLSESAKIRAQDSLRKANSRKRTRHGQVADNSRTEGGHDEDASVTRGEESRGEETRGDSGGVGGGGFGVGCREGGIELTSRQIVIYDLLKVRPRWLPKQHAWLDVVTARDLALLPTTSVPLVRWALEDTKGKVRTLTNPAGVFKTAIRKADSGLIAGLNVAAREAQEAAFAAGGGVLMGPREPLPHELTIEPAEDLAP